MRSFLLLAAAVAVSTPLALATGQPALRLSTATGALTAEFSSVTSVRELADGRLLVVDNREQRLVVGDFRSGEVSQIGRAGPGPDEYRNPRLLFALAADTTILPAPGSRWIVLAGTVPVATWGPDRTQKFLTRGDVFGVALNGDVYGRVAGGASCHETESDRPDTVYVVRRSRVAERTDTVGRLTVAPTTRRTANLNGSLTTRCMPPVLPLNDDVVAFPDGWLAIVRQSPYRVDWHDARGTNHVGKPLPGVLPPVTERDRKAIVDSFPSRPGRMPDFDFDRFPARAPAFQGGALVPASDGRVMIRRTLLASDTESRYDIVDRSSTLVATLRMQRNQRVAGFGRASVFVVTVDSDGLQRITRHPWP